MSWTVYLYDAVPIDEFTVALDGALERANIPEQNQAGVEQAAFAVKLAKEIVASGLVVGLGQKVVCSLSGHANEEHQPKPGWANDEMTIRVWQAN